MSQKNSKRNAFLGIGIIGLIVLGLLTYKYLQSSKEDDVITIGINTPTAKTFAIAAEEAKQQGIHVKLVEFSDWSAPNIALSHGDLDANYYQHRPFLENEIKERNYQFDVAGIGTSTHVGLYSKKYKSLDEIPNGATVVIPNDPVNQGRALLLLQQAKLIELKDPNNHLSGLKEISSNPKNLKFTEVEGPQTARALNDVDLAFGYPNYLKLSNIHDPRDALIFDEPTGNRYALLFVTQKNYQDKDQKLAKFIKIFQSSEKVKQTIDEDFGADLWYADWK